MLADGAEPPTTLSSRTRLLIEDMCLEWGELDRRIAALTAEFVARARGRPGRAPSRYHPRLRRSQRDRARRRDRHGRDLPPGARSRCLAGLGLVPRQATTGGRASRDDQARQYLPAHAPDPWRPSGLAVALGEPNPNGRVAARPRRTHSQKQSRGRARRQARPDRLGSPAVRRELREGRTAGDGLNEIDRRSSPAAAVSDVCGRWTRDGLTVDPAPWNPGLKYGARRRKSYEGQG